MGPAPCLCMFTEKAGTYKARLKITVEGKGRCENTSEDAVTINVMDAPRVVINMPLEGCPGQALNFSFETPEKDKTNIYIRWDFGDGSLASGKNCVHYLKTPGDLT